MSKMTRITQDMANEYVARGYWGTRRTSDLWDDNARRNPDKEALVDSKKRLTYGQIKTLSDRFAYWLLENGFKRDEVLVMQLPNCVESFVVRLGCEKAGVLCAPAQMNMRYSEMEAVCRKLSAVSACITRSFHDTDYYDVFKEIQCQLPALRKIIVMGDSVPSDAISLDKILDQPMETRYPEGYLEGTKFGEFEVAVIGVTSGTWGVPKLVEHPILARVAVGIAHAHSVNLNKDDTLAVVTNTILGGGAPLAYNGGAPYYGAKVALLESWNTEECLRLLERERVTVLRIVPTQLIMILKHPDLSKYRLNLRGIETGTAPLPWEMAKLAEEKLNARVINTYGAFDGGLFSHASVDQPPEVRWKTSGQVVPGIEIRIVDDDGKDVPSGEVGEAIFRGALTVSGYFNDLQATIRAWGCVGREGWFKTGDLARLDEGGNLVIVGRKKDMVLRGGQNIYPQEIENTLLTHPKVAQAAVVAMPDPVMGERACAYIAPKKGQTFTFDEMTTLLRERRIASFKIPERLEIRDSLPIGALGKVVKRDLAEDIRMLLQLEGKL